MTALVRDLSRVSVRDPGLTLFEGDVKDQEAVRRTVVNRDAVLVALRPGAVPGQKRVLSEGTRNIVQGMEANGIRRIVCLLSGWLFYAAIPPQFLSITREHARQLAVLQGSSLDGVAVCPPALTERPQSGSYAVSIGEMPGRSHAGPIPSGAERSAAGPRG